MAPPFQGWKGTGRAQTRIGWRVDRENMILVEGEKGFGLEYPGLVDHWGF
jgi:hypothetical protein